jgi:hypothetical protein
MEKDVEKLIEAFTDQAMTKEGRACVLGYAKGRLDAQRKLTQSEKNSMGEIKTNKRGGQENEKNECRRTSRV